MEDYSGQSSEFRPASPAAPRTAAGAELENLVRFKVYKRRWFVLLVFCLLNCSNAMVSGRPVLVNICVVNKVLKLKLSSHCSEGSLNGQLSCRIMSSFSNISAKTQRNGLWYGGSLVPKEKKKWWCSLIFMKNGNANLKKKMKVEVKALLQ